MARALGIPLALSLLVLASASPASADNFPVTKTADTNDGACNFDCSLREAVAAANALGGADDISVPPGTYTLSQGPLAIFDDTFIDGDDVNLPQVVAAPGSRVFDISGTAVTDTVVFQELVIRGGNVSGAGGGIRNVGLGPMVIIRSVIRDNTATGSGAAGGGGGVYHQPTTQLTIEESTVTNNTATVAGSSSGGGGIYAQGAAVLRNSTIYANHLNTSGPSPGSGGGGFFTNNGSGLLSHVTINHNTSAIAGGGVYNDGGTPVTLENSIIADNTGSPGSQCDATAPDGFTSDGDNLERGDTCELDDPQDQPDTNPLLGPLVDNGGPTPTSAIPKNSPAVDLADINPCPGSDQRGAGRPTSNGCDIGAYEFTGTVDAGIPDCSPSGQIPLDMTAPPGDGVVAFHYKVDGGPTQDIPTPGGGSEAGTTLTFPEGRRTLQYWGEYGFSGEQVERPAKEVLVDQTDPTVGIQAAKSKKILVIKRRVNVTVDADDALSGLTDDPSGATRVDTSRRGKRTLVSTAIDLCENQSSAAFDYRVLAPKLGVRTVVEPLGKRVKIRLPGRGASGGRASQKGIGLVRVRQPRELPVGAFVDTRGGTARITTSSNARSGIQDGKFLGGLFQALQSRSRSRKGLTELRLKGASFRRCRTAGLGKLAGAAQRRRLGSGTIRRLKGNAKGRFRTRGRHSAATVRGTIWTISDRCDGTLTSVKRGKVAVRDFRRKRTVLVRAGKSYLARAGF